MLKIGRFEVQVLSDGEFRLDGGAMFGIVPRVLWERVSPPDERNRIRLGLTSLLVRFDDRLMLIDTGCGGRWSPKELDIYGIQRQGGLAAALGRVGMRPEQITDVLLTHLHFDHGGGNTRLDDRGELVPAFPNATYRVQAENLAWARSPLELDRASYRPDDFEPLVERGQLETQPGGGAVFPGVRTVVTGGHTAGHQAVIIEDGRAGLVFFADVVPTSRHLKAPYIMGYDLFPTHTLQWKKRLLQQAFENDWVCVFEHDPDTPWGRLRRGERGHYQVEPLDPGPWKS